MEMTPHINEKDLEKMPILKRSEFLFDYKNKLHADNLDDGYHNLKRNTGFVWFDRMLKDCQNGSCPKYISEDIVYILSDMSLEGYILQKAYHLSKAKVGINDEERYYKALGEINCVMNCKNESQLDIKILNHDSKQVYYKAKKQSAVYQSARLRKAYWAYLKGAPNNDQIKDYFSTCEYIDKVHRIYNKKTCTSDDCERYKEILSENCHVANPLDLFRLCIIRKKQS
jgi:hypothetical protein